VTVSDLSGKTIEADEQLGRLVVEAHPELPAGSPVMLDVLPEEIESGIAQAQDAVALSYYAPGEEQPRRVVMPIAAFEQLSQQQTMSDILQTARQAQEESGERAGRTRRRRATRTGGPKIDYASPEHAGMPHRGWATEAEKAYVREHLAEVNARRTAKGLAEIDPADSRMAKRYGFPAAEPA
jgi:hypothetical protein